MSSLALQQSNDYTERTSTNLPTHTVCSFLKHLKFWSNLILEELLIINIQFLSTAHKAPLFSWDLILNVFFFFFFFQIRICSKDKQRIPMLSPASLFFHIPIILRNGNWLSLLILLLWFPSIEEVILTC